VIRRKAIIPPYADPDGTHVPYTVCASPVEDVEQGCPVAGAIVNRVVEPGAPYSGRVRVVVARGNAAPASAGVADDELMSNLKFDFAK